MSSAPATGAGAVPMRTANCWTACRTEARFDDFNTTSPGPSNAGEAPDLRTIREKQPGINSALHTGLRRRKENSAASSRTCSRRPPTSAACRRTCSWQKRAKTHPSPKQAPAPSAALPCAPLPCSTASGDGDRERPRDGRRRFGGRDCDCCAAVPGLSPRRRPSKRGGCDSAGSAVTVAATPCSPPQLLCARRPVPCRRRNKPATRSATELAGHGIAQRRRHLQQ
mmetsp:Transcript_39502/g.108843  ORF Transcript_39502/g.108843 Transcript_39502/m.108843 type:complete len:225 (-) Transcript_39502:218-892(-)